MVVTHPFHVEGGGARTTADGCGVAVARAERAKLRDYAPTAGGAAANVVPLAMETLGRRGPAAELELRRLARARVERAVHSALGAAQAYGAVLCRWRQRLSVVLMRGSHEVLRACAAAPPPGRVHAAPGEAELHLLCVG